MQLNDLGVRVGIRWQTNRASMERLNWGEVEPRLRMEEVESFTIGYLGDYGGEWLEEWPESPANPVAVRLNIKSRNKYWPELVVRLDPGGLNP